MNCVRKLYHNFLIKKKNLHTSPYTSAGSNQLISSAISQFDRKIPRFIGVLENGKVGKYMYMLAVESLLVEEGGKSLREITQRGERSV